MVEECAKNCRSTARGSIEWSLEFKQYLHCFRFCSRSLNSTIGRGSGLSLTKNLPESWVASQSLERPLSPHPKVVREKALSAWPQCLGFSQSSPLQLHWSGSSYPRASFISRVSPIALAEEGRRFHRNSGLEGSESACGAQARATVGRTESHAVSSFEQLQRAIVKLNERGIDTSGSEESSRPSRD